MLNDFLNDEIQKLLGKIRVEIGPVCQILETRDLTFLTRGVGWGQVMMRLEKAHRLSVFEPLCKGKDQNGIKPVDTVAMLLEKLLRAGDDI